MALLTYETQYINGEFVKTSNAGRFLDVIDSDTAQVFAKVPDGSAEDMSKAIAAAKAAFTPWSQTPLEERKDYVRKILSNWQAKKPQAISVLQKELGCTQKFAERVQASLADMHIETSLALIDKVQFEETTSMGALVLKEPIGVVGCITPWNYPLNQIAAKIIPAMLVGCTVVLKPSEVTPINAYLMAEAIHEAGLPKGVFNMVIGTAMGVGETLSSHPDVDLISVTGSVRAGKQITAAGAQTLKVVRTELGGKSASLLLDDADLPKLIPEFIGQLMENSGQTCIALSRMLVPKSKYEEAVGIAKKVAEGVVVGRPSDPNATMGPMASQSQWNIVQHYIKKGIEEGARMVAGGLGKPEGLEDGFYAKPTIFADVNNQMSIAREEIFGPVLCMIPYESEKEGIDIVNDTVFGLNNAVGSSDTARAVAVARQLRSGTVMINGTKLLPDAPFGGYKQSGNAREWGMFGLEEYLVTKHLAGNPHSNL